MGLKVEIEQKEKTAFFEWEEGVFFQVKYITRQRRKEIAKKAITIVFSKHQRREDYDAERFGELLLKEVLVGWKGFRYKHLIGVCEPNIKIKTDPEEEIPFNEEAKEFIIKHRTITFENFIVNALDAFEQMREEELKNLKSSSAGSEAQEGSQRNK